MRGFATRNKRYSAATTPDRFMLGGRVDVMQSRNFLIGLNYIYQYDALRTIANPNTFLTNQNQVVTGDFKIN